MAADENVLNVPASSRLKPVPRGKWNPVGANSFAKAVCQALIFPGHTASPATGNPPGCSYRLVAAEISYAIKRRGWLFGVPYWVIKQGANDEQIASTLSEYQGSSMSGNPYLPPESDLQTDRVHAPAFYIVSPVKFAVLLIATLGMYKVYWSYKNWALYKASTGLKAWPVMRGLFEIVFVYSLFSKINRRLIESGRDYRWRPRLRAVTLIALVAFGLIQDQLFSFTVVLILTPVYIALDVYLFTGAQRAINYLENDVNGQSNRRLSLLNYVWILLGFCLWGATYWVITNLIILEQAIVQ